MNAQRLRDLDRCSGSPRAESANSVAISCGALEIVLRGQPAARILLIDIGALAEMQISASCASYMSVVGEIRHHWSPPAAGPFHRPFPRGPARSAVRPRAGRSRPDDAATRHTRRLGNTALASCCNSAWAAGRWPCPQETLPNRTIGATGQTDQPVGMGSSKFRQASPAATGHPLSDIETAEFSFIRFS